jgi:hypothetical protein
MDNQGVVRSWYRWLVVMIILSMGTSFHASSQLRSIQTLSTVSVHHLPLSVRFPQLLHRSSSRTPDLLAYVPDSSAFVLFSGASDGTFGEYRIVARSANVTTVAISNVNNDGIDDVVVVHREQNSVEVFFSRKSDSSYVPQTFPVNFYPERVVIGDITNDRIPDIISFGKLSSGLSVLQGKGNGKFAPVKTLFENIPVSECALIALNGDQIPDIAIHNWLTNETSIHLGLGKLKFSEQTVLSFAQDTVQTLFTDVTGDGISDVAVLSVQNSSLQLLQGDGLGNFSFSQAIPLSALSHRIRSGAVSATAPDLLIFDNTVRTASLMVNRGDGSFYDEIVYGLGGAAAELLTTDMNSDGANDAVIFYDDGKTYMVLWNSRTRTTQGGSEQRFAVGQNPGGIYVSDITGDGLDDIVVSNEGSGTLSILRSTGTTFAGQASIETPERPVSVSLYAKTDSSVTLYTSHRENPKVSLFSLRKEPDSLNSLVGDLEQFSISLPDKPVNVLPDVSYMQKGISLYAFMSTAPNAIVFYQQVKGTRFLAKSLVPLVPAKIIYSTINDLNFDGKTDLMYIYSNSAARSTVLGVTLNDSSGEFKGKVYSFALPDSTVKKAFLFIDDLNGDQLKDCLMYSAPDNVIRVALGNRSSLFGPFEPVLGSLIMKVPDQVQIYDVNNDGILDLVFLDKDSGTLWSYRGKGNGMFFPRRPLATVPADAAFRCGDFNGDGNIDIVFTHPEGHTVTVIYGS